MKDGKDIARLGHTPIHRKNQPFNKIAAIFQLNFQVGPTLGQQGYRRPRGVETGEARAAAALVYPVEMMGEIALGVLPFAWQAGGLDIAIAAGFKIHDARKTRGCAGYHGADTLDVGSGHGFG